MPSSDSTRIAVVQHGDYSAAQKLLREGRRETYAGMAHSVEALEELFENHPHLVISLDAPPRREITGNCTHVGIPLPPPRLWRRGPLNMRHWGQSVCSELEAFRPTHFLCRTAGDLALRVLRCSIAHRWPTLAMFANAFHSASSKGQRVERALGQLLNDPTIWRVANHRQISTASMVNCGVNESKVIAYDFPGSRIPAESSLKTLDRAKPVELLYAASMIRAKGLGDLIEALAILTAQGIPARLTAFGVGSALEDMKALAQRVAPGQVDFPGQVGNDVLFDHMRRCTVMCVTTRPQFQEGGSLVLTEALASRTPVALSDQPLFKKTFHDEEGITFFNAANPESLANTILKIISSESHYTELSRTTAQAYARATCETTFADVLRQWRAGWRISESAAHV